MIRELLEKVSRGDRDRAAQEEIVRALYEQGEDFLLDLHRHHRTGFPEVIYARGKSTDQVLRIVRSFLDKAGRAFVSLIDDELEDALRRAFPDARTVRAGGLAVVASGEAHRERLGTVGILTAGTADTPHAGECGLLLEDRRERDQGLRLRGVGDAPAVSGHPQDRGGGRSDRLCRLDGILPP